MATQISKSTKTVGFWSAVLATVFSITYVVGQLAEWLGLLQYPVQKVRQLARAQYPIKGVF